MAVSSVSPYLTYAYSGACTVASSQGTDAPDDDELHGQVSGVPGHSEGTPKAAQELTDEEKQEVQELKQRDREVRAHEQAHVAAGGHYVKGGASFEYTSGPDGKRYANGGEVSIDTSAVPGDPQATIRKMQTVKQAALAPAQPSGQDRSVAAAASQTEAQARQEVMKKRAQGEDGEKSTETVDGAKPENKTSSYTPQGNPVSEIVDQFTPTIDLIV